MSNAHESNKRLARNTLILYIRMFLTVGVSLYITRVVLQNLGVNQFGLYNLIGGFVSMFYIVTASLSGAISRFITFELGRDDTKKVIQTFSMSINIQILFSLIVLALGETLGLWFVNTQLNIDSEQLWAANIVFQLSLISFIVELLGVPYYSLVVAHERMGLFAFNAILAVLLKLLLALLLVCSVIDRVVFYAVGMLIISIISQLIYVSYSKCYFVECKYVRTFNKALFLQMFSFGGWNLLTSASSMLRSQGLNILLNMFFGTVVNAAFGVARHIESTIRAFSKNFLTALQPQITKSYAEGNISHTKALVYKGAKYSFLLLFMIGLPFILLTDFFMDIWLVNVPIYANRFAQLIIILSLVEMLLMPVGYLNEATGDIKKYKIVTSIGQFLVLPISYVFLKLDFNPYYTLYIAIAAELITLPYRIQVNKLLAGVTFQNYFNQVILKLLPVIAISIAMGVVLKHTLPVTTLSHIVITLLTIITILAASYFFAVDQSEKKLAIKILTKTISIFGKKDRKNIKYDR